MKKGWRQLVTGLGWEYVFVYSVVRSSVIHGRGQSLICTGLGWQVVGSVMDSKEEKNSVWIHD